MNATGDARPFQCQVCFEKLSAADTVTLGACSHVCCRKCLRQHVTGKISCGQLKPSCFYPISHTGGSPQLCSGVVSEAEIKRLVDPKTLMMYRRFQFNAQHPVLGRQCPHCDHCQVFPHGEQQADCTCEACGTTFCFSHSLAHVGRTCGEYEDAIRQVERVTITAIERTTKRCPECDVTIEKDGGCNHMTCLKCGASFCWLCLSFIEQTAFPEHYRTFSLSGCAGLQSANDGRFMWAHRAGRLAARGLIGVVVGVPALAITAVLTVLTLGWYPMRSVYGGSVWGASKVCFYFTAVGLFQTLDQMREDIVQGLRDLMPVFLRRS